jgi:four helix bundle protein
MANKTSTEVIEGMIQLSVDVISLCQQLHLPRSVVDQVTRSVTSIGANFTEAQDASSKKDFLSKIYIAKKEASETKYWLAIIVKLTGDSDELIAVSEATQRYVMMLQKIVNTSREPNRKSPTANSSQMDNR